MQKSRKHDLVRVRQENRATTAICISLGWQHAIGVLVVRRHCEDCGGEHYHGFRVSHKEITPIEAFGF